jgi:hypothetical protein
MTKSIDRGMKRALVAVLGALALSGCVLEKKDDASRFREAIPEADKVAVSGPEDGQASGSASGQSIQSDEPWANGPWAKWYGFTRYVRHGVNTVTGVVLGSVWIIVHTEPTSVADKEAIWGPYTDSLEPASYRFRVTEVAEGEYDYTLEGRAKQSQNDSDYRAVLSGHGYGKGHASHGDGWFKIDLDTAKALDPFNYKSDESGTIKVTHDLPPNITKNLFAQPRTVTAEVYPTTSDQWFKATSHSEADGTGTLLVDAFADTDDSNMTQNENISILSEWNGTGAGRADISIDGGDVPSSMGTVKAVECWGSDFYRVYYQDSVDYEATEGDATMCAFSEPAAP